MAVFGFGRRNAVGRQYNGGNVSVMLPRYTTPPERNTRDWLEMFGRNPRLAVVDFDVLIGTDAENLQADNIPVDSRSKVVTDDGMVTIDA